jgi:hypothetical protein
MHSGNQVRPSPTVLSTVDAGLGIALDTCSEISIGRIGFLKNVRLVRKPVFVEGLGGIRVFDTVGDLLLAGNHYVTVFAVKKGEKNQLQDVSCTPGFSRPLGYSSPREQP